MTDSKLVASIALGAIVGALPTVTGATMVSFRDGVNGYTGTQDTELRQDRPTANFGSASNITIDGDDAPGPLDDTNALVKFGDIFGLGAGQIPLGSTINSATLRLELHSKGDNVSMLRMLVDWDQSTATWDSLNVGGGGIQDIAGEATFVRLLTNLTGNHTATTADFLDFDVLPELAQWAGGVSNFGWGFTPTGNDGFDFHASEHSLDGHRRPTLEVDFTAPQRETRPPGIPEPSTIALMGLSLLALGLARRRRRMLV